MIVPLFALANAGIAISGDVPRATSPVALGIVLGLVVGKLVGIAAATWSRPRWLGRCPMSWARRRSAGPPSRASASRSRSSS